MFKGISELPINIQAYVIKLFENLNKSIGREILIDLFKNIILVTDTINECDTNTKTVTTQLQKIQLDSNTEIKNLKQQLDKVSTYNETLLWKNNKQKQEIKKLEQEKDMILQINKELINDNKHSTLIRA